MNEKINEETKRYVLITGARGGMGAAAVKSFLNNGYGVFALDKGADDKNEANAASENKNLFFINCDVTDENDVLSALQKVKSVTQDLCAIIHFAGVYMLDSLIEIEPENFEKIFKVNLFGAFLINRTFVPLLSKKGKIIMVTSELAALKPLPFTGLYAISKIALDNYAYSLKMELQLKDIFVSVIRAGAVSTGMLGVSTSALDKFCDKTKAYAVSADRFKKIVGAIEAKSVPPEKIAEKTLKIFNSKSPKFAYSINRNFLLRLYGLAPSCIKFGAIKKILK